MNKYLDNLLDQIHDDIQNCPCDSAPTIKLLNIMEKLQMAVKHLAQQEAGATELLRSELAVAHQQYELLATTATRRIKELQHVDPELPPIAVIAHHLRDMDDAPARAVIQTIRKHKCNVDYDPKTDKVLFRVDESEPEK